jgi:hypothetical protein
MNRTHPSRKTDQQPVILFTQLGSGLYYDMVSQTAVFTDINSAADFRRRFPGWEVRCLITLPRFN